VHQGDALRLGALLRGSCQYLLVEAGQGHGGGHRAVGHGAAVEHGRGNAESVKPRGSFWSGQRRQAQLQHVFRLHPGRHRRALQRRYVARQTVLQ
jgi:hypothetical protein